MSIGILTSGGDCPGLNAVIRGAVMKGDKIYEQEFVGIRDGWRGLIVDDVFSLPRRRVRGLSKEGGTILGTSRTHPYKGIDGVGGPDAIRSVMERHGMEGVIAIGGEGTLSGAARLAADGLPVVGVPKTIDNDLSGTDYTFGFNTAVSIATESIDRLRTTTEAHHRCMVVEVMGRHVGWIALHAGIASGAHAILIPEVSVTLEQITEWVLLTQGRGRAPVVVVSEGFQLKNDKGELENIAAERGLDAAGRPRLGGIGEALAPLIERSTGIETRAATLGHLQRGGVPTAYDRVLATRFGHAAIDAVMQRKWGQMVALSGIDIVTVPMAEATKELKTVPRQQWDDAAVLFG